MKAPPCLPQAGKPWEEARVVPPIPYLGGDGVEYFAT